MKQTMKRTSLWLLALLLVLSSLFGCQAGDATPTATTASETTATTATFVSSFHISGSGRLTLKVGNTLQLELITDATVLPAVEWKATNDSVTVSNTGLVTGIEEGVVAVSATYKTYKATVLIEVITASDLPDSGEKDAFYGDYKPAQSLQDALERSQQGLLSGSITVPDEAPTVAENRPMEDGKYIRNSESYYLGNDTYIVVNTKGQEVLRIYRGGGYITLEEVAAYVYAFGDVPANYVAGKNVDPENSIWGEYLRLNHTAFSGSTTKYPYEPMLPNISGCGGDLYYYEIDIGTTGTTCDPSYPARIYNDGKRITRGAARIVYTRYDKNRNQIIDPDERYVFYTFNHYNDFQEYLNYFHGWGEMFGNITGGGKLSSKTDYNPTPYVAVIRKPITTPVVREADPLHQPVYYIFVDPRVFAWTEM